MIFHRVIFLKKKSISEIKTNPGSDRAEAPPDQPHGRDALPLPPLLEVLQQPHRPQAPHQEGAPDASQHRHRHQAGAGGLDLLSL